MLKELKRIIAEEPRAPDYSIRWSDPQYLPLCQKELCIRSPAVTRIAGNEFAVICFLWICYIVDDVTDCPTFCATLANMKRHDSCSCHYYPSLQK